MLAEAAAQCETLKVQLRETRRREREQADTVRILREELRVCRDDAAQSLAAAQAQQAEEARRHEEELKRVRSAAQVISDELDRRRRSEGDVHARLESSEARCAVAEGRVSEAEAWRLARARESHELQVHHRCISHISLYLPISPHISLLGFRLDMNKISGAAAKAADEPDMLKWTPRARPKDAPKQSARYQSQFKSLSEDVLECVT